MNLAETGSGASAVWTTNAGTVTAGVCSGGMAVYHNRARVLGNTCFTSVTYNTTCCSPVSGTSTTSYSRTTNSTGAIASALDGRNESLTYTGCGTATLVDATGASSPVTTKTCF